MMQNHNNTNGNLLDIRSLQEQVYEYLRNEMQSERLFPGSLININKISKQLGISKTPLRDALIKLECEGFVTILPRRGIMVNKFTLEKIKNTVEIIAALESAVIVSVFDKITPEHIKKMRKINTDLKFTMQNSTTNSFDKKYYQLNIAFHDVFLDLSSNTDLKNIIMPLKQKLYDWPRLTYIREWELINCDEHDQLLTLFADGTPEEAGRLWRDFHWSFAAHEEFIKKFYAQGNEQIQNIINSIN
ncbi:MAG: GntR family transcriptional regulator [Thermodesulfobacteriota bacterium]